jgi:hypothetical protein
MSEFEDLPQPGPSKQRRRLRIDIAVGALVLLGVVLFLRASTRDHHHSSPAPSTSAAATPIGGFGTPPDSGSGLLGGVPEVQASATLPPLVDGDPTACPPKYPCASSRHVPPGVVAAVQAVFPTARVQDCYTVRLSGRPDGLLWFREINADLNGASLVIQLQAPPPTGNAVPNGRSGTTTFYSAEHHGYFVSIEFDWPGSVSGVLARLAADRRLMDA